MKEKLKMLVVMMVLLALVFALPVLAEGQDGQEAVLLDLTKLAQAVISLAAGIVLSLIHIERCIRDRDISILTGEPLDAFYTGRMARIIYRDYGLTIRARVREIHYPKPVSYTHLDVYTRQAMT